MIHETIALPGNEHQKTNLLSNEISTGIFGEYSYKPDEKFNMLLGSRLDYHNKFGFFVTPRIHLRYSPVKEIMFRASAGKGYRSPKVLAENAFFLASNREIVLDDNLKMESAANYGFAVQTFPKIFEKELNLTAEWFLTDFQNQVVVDMDEGVHKVHFYNLQGKSYASSIQLEANMEVVRGLTLTVAHRWNKVETTYDGILREKPLTNRTKGLITASYQTPLKKWQFDFTTQFNGGGRMPLADVSNPLWKDEFSPFTIINSQITKYFKKWSVYAGVENLTGFVQENPVIDVANPFGDNFDATMIWGPTHGRKLYLGFRWSIDGETKI
jgi:outer membrane receptor for ferrienterochelin and colicin